MPTSLNTVSPRVSYGISTYNVAGPYMPASEFTCCIVKDIAKNIYILYQMQNVHYACIR